MPSYPRSAWTRLGELLVRRRIELDPRYRNRRAFTSERAVEYRIVNDVELGRRENYEQGTIAALEVAYDLTQGSIGRVLGGGELDPGGIPRRENPVPPAEPPPGPGYGDFPPVSDELLGKIAAYLPDLKQRLEVVRGMNPAGKISGSMMFPVNTPDPAARERNRRDAARWDKIAETFPTWKPESILMGMAVHRADEADVQAEHNRRASGLPARRIAAR